MSDGTTPRTIHIPSDLLGEIVVFNKNENEKRKKSEEPKLNSSEEILELVKIGLAVKKGQKTIC